MSHKIKYGEFDPAASDGCTVVSQAYKFFSNGKQTPFRQCCINHDRIYYYGGDVALRKRADVNLRRCVKRHGFPILAWAMYLAVRVFSGPHMPFGWSWEKKITILPKQS